MPVQQVLTNQRVPVKIWTDDIDERSKEQLTNIASLPFIHHHVAALAGIIRKTAAHTMVMQVAGVIVEVRRAA